MREAGSIFLTARSRVCFVAGVLLASVRNGPAPAANNTVPVDCKRLLEQFLREEMAGARLTDGGWYRSAHYFLKPERPPSYRVLAVIKPDKPPYGAPYYRVLGGRRVDGYLPCSFLGQIDSAGRFTSMVVPSLVDGTGRWIRSPVPIIHGPAMFEFVFELVQTDSYWEFDSKLNRPHQVKGPTEWKLMTFSWQSPVTVDTAIRYLEGLSHESNSEAIRRNAVKSIEKLRVYRKTPSLSPPRLKGPGRAERHAGG
jgi:hypothetical protein